MNIILLLIWLTLTGISEPFNSAPIVLKDGQYELRLENRTMQMEITSTSTAILVPKDPVSGLYLNKEPVVSTKLLKKSVNSLELSVKTEKNEEAKVEITYLSGVISLVVAPENEGSNHISIRFAGMPVAHGLGDAGGWNKTFDLAGVEEKQYKIENDGGRKRWLSTFCIFPKNSFGGVFFDRGKRNVILSEGTFQQNIETKGVCTFYFFTGNVKEIYSNYQKIRNEVGFQDIKPKSRLFELGWESWDALGWNTNQNTVREILSKFQTEGYPIRWAVTGSGFWDEGGTTTSFGRFGEKFSDPDQFKKWMHQNDIRWMIGLRTNLLPAGGPFYPVTEKRDKNLKVQSFYGNEKSDEAIEKKILLTDSNNVPIKISSKIFPIVPCYLIDGNKPAAAAWFQKSYNLWNVDGIKEDTMMDLGYETSIFNKPIAKIATEGGLVMARCGEFISPGTLQRINDTGVRELASRIPINYFQYAASGAPNVYSDVAGVHNMSNTLEMDLNIRHAWLLSLTAGMAVGAFPSKWQKEKQEIFKKVIDFHHTLVPYIFSAGMQAYLTGYPYTLSPMSLAYSSDEAAREFKNFQWMIGESVLATPLLKNYKDGKKDVYLPAGIWYDWETNKKFTGPVTLKKYEFPLKKSPCFIGGNGVVILRDRELKGLKARVYKVDKEVRAHFYTLDEGKNYWIEISNPDLDQVSVQKLATGEKVDLKRARGYIEFEIEEGKNYRVK